MYSYDFSEFESILGENPFSKDNLINSFLNNSDLIIKLLRVFLILVVISCIVETILLIAKWKVYSKANQRGWASMIPIYDNYVLFEIVGISGWYSFFRFIPVLGKLFITILKLIAYFKLAKCFNKDIGFSIGLILFRVIFLPILAFDSSTYTKLLNK